MRKGFWSICLSVVVLVALIVVLVPGCTGEAEQGTIEVKATLCGDPWPTQGTGSVNYTLTPASGSAINGTTVPASFSVDAGTWTCGNVSGGPAGAFLESITPASVTVAEGETKTITLNFELDQDAWIEFLTWTVSGDPIGVPGEPVEHEVVPCQIIDVHFGQGVEGCPGYNVTVKETSWLHITQTFGPGPVQVVVVNDSCAVVKDHDAVKKSQYASFNEEPVLPGQYWPIPPPEEELPALLDVETTWELVKETDYTKAINWLGISLFEPMPHPCVLFELVLPTPGIYTFQLQASAEVELVDDVDVNPDNDHAIGPVLTLTVTAL